MPAPNLSSGSPNTAACEAIVTLRTVPEAHNRVEAPTQDRAPLDLAARPPLHLLLEIEAGGETAPGAAHDDDPHLGRAFGAVERLAERVQRRAVEGIALRGAVEGDARDRAHGLK